MDMGLALGAGGARGLAHAGFLRTLAREGFRPACVAGSSIGAVVGAVFCGGDLEEFCEWVGGLSTLEALRLLDPVFPRSGFVEGQRLLDKLQEFLRVDRLEDCSPRLAVVAVRADNGEGLVLTSGPILQAVRASIAVPGLLTAGLWDGLAMLDGALAEPLPVTACRRLGAGAVTAVDVSSEVMEARRKRDSGPSTAETLRTGAARLLAALGPRLGDRQQFAAQFISRWLEDDGADPRPTLVEAVLDAMSIAQRSIKAARLRQDPPEHIVTPAVGDLRFLDFHRGSEALAAGAAAAGDFLRQVRG